MSADRPLRVLVVTHGPAGARVGETVRNERIGDRVLEFSGVHSFGPSPDLAVVRAALQMIDSTRPAVVVEALGVPRLAAMLALCAFRASACVVSASSLLRSPDGARLHELATVHGVSLHLIIATDSGHVIRHALAQAAGRARQPDVELPLCW